jgi:hypothetical protein
VPTRCDENVTREGKAKERAVFMLQVYKCSRQTWGHGKTSSPVLPGRLAAVAPASSSSGCSLTAPATPKVVRFRPERLASKPERTLRRAGAPARGACRSRSRSLRCGHRAAPPPPFRAPLPPRATRPLVTPSQGLQALCRRVRMRSFQSVSEARPENGRRTLSLGHFVPFCIFFHVTVNICHAE